MFTAWSPAADVRRLASFLATNPQRCLLPSESNIAQQKALRDELALLRRLANGRRVASTLLPTLRRTALQPANLPKRRRDTAAKGK
jgi:hypothetical protein